MKRACLSTLSTIAASALLGGVLATGAPVTAMAEPTTPGPAQCDYPAEILDLTNWKHTLPIDDPDESGTQPLEIFQPELDSYTIDPWFRVNSACDGVQFRNAVNGVTTPNSSYSRSELREMTNNGSSHASWSSTSGGPHILTIDQAITHLPNDKPHVVAGQIHDSDDDVTVFRLQGSNLYVTNGNDSDYHLITDDYQLGTRFEAKFVVDDGQISAYYNGELQTTLDKSFSGGYFKAGAYTQANCGNSAPCSSSNYGQVIVYDVTVTHGQSEPPPPPPGDELEICGVTASGDDGNVPANAIDGDLGTRWSDEGDGVWIRFDLCEQVVANAVAIAWHQGDRRRASFQVQTSTDGSSWTTAVARRDSSGTTLQPELYEFTDRTGRYLRIVGYGNTNNDWTSITEVDVYGETDSGAACDYPAQLLNLTNWKVTLPVDNPDQSGQQPLEVRQPALSTYMISPWFKLTSTCDGVQFRSPVNGVTTPNSSYARSELREMTNNGSSNASWSSTSGTHTMVIRQAIKNLPADKPHVVAGQIHDSSDDVSVFRLEGSNLYVTNGNTSHHKLVTSNYVLGTKFEAKFVVSGGQIRAYYNGVLQTTIPAGFSGGYFKAGGYTQANCGNSSPCSRDNFGQVMIYNLTVTHS